MRAYKYTITHIYTHSTVVEGDSMDPLYNSYYTEM